MTEPASTSRYTSAEEIANGVSHGVGVLLAMAGTAVLIEGAAAYGDPWQVAGWGVFGAALIFLYSASMSVVR